MILLTWFRKAAALFASVASIFTAVIILHFLVACTSTTSTPQPTPSSTPPPSDPPQSSPTPTLACETHTVALDLLPSAVELKVGETLTLTVILANPGCANVGLLLYRLRVEPDSPAFFDPASPDPVEHTLGVSPGGTDTAEFTLTAIAPGNVEITATVSFEVHLGYPGPAYFASASSGDPLVITIIE